MLFSGGMIPTYLVVQSLGLLDSFPALFLPQLLSAYYIFVMRNALQAIPSSLAESAYIDGSGPFRTLFVIIFPVATPTVAAIAMFYMVRYWNSYKECLLYINKPRLQVLQIYLRNMIAAASSMEMTNGYISSQEQNMLSEETVKMTAVAISIIPVLIVYPFLQRFYTKGMVTGAVKG